MKITATEDRMHKSGDPYLNHTRPSSAVRLLEKFIQQELLSPVYQKFLENTMIATSTGSDKLKGLLPAETIIGHKTGSSDRDSTGMKAGDNDMGFVYLPHGGDHYTIAVFITDSMEDDKTNFKSSIRLYKRNIFVRCIVKPCLSVKPTYLTQMLSLWKTKKLS